MAASRRTGCSRGPSAVQAAGTCSPSSAGGTRRGPNGERLSSYFCKGSHAAGKCPAPGVERVALVDDFVRKAISQALGDGMLEGTIDSIARYERARRAVAKAQCDLDAIKTNPKLIASLGVEGVVELTVEQKGVLDAAKLALRETPEPGNAIAPDQHLWVNAETWPIYRQRQLAKQFIAEATLTRSGKGRGSGPVQERLSIRWVGHDEPDRYRRARAGDAGRGLPATGCLNQA
jgi:hypothetical protein